MEHDDTMDSLRHWQDLWDQASNNFEPTPPPDINVILSRLTLPEDSEDADKELTLNEMLAVSQDMFKETVTDPQDVTKYLNGEYMLNPTHFASLGKDQELRVTPNFNDGETLRELNAVKLALHALEDKINTANAVGTEKEENSLKKELESVRSKFEELSNKLMPHPMNDPT